MSTSFSGWGTATTPISVGGSTFGTITVTANQLSQYKMMTGTTASGSTTAGVRYILTAAGSDGINVDWDGSARELNNQLTPGQEYILPDGAKIHLDAKGNYTINDIAAKLVYRANNNRDFNRYINASDLLAEFIEELRKRGWKQANVLQAPAELFINWLVFKAAQHDNEPPPAEVAKIETARPPALPKCNCCGRYISQRLATSGFRFCNVDHATKYLERKGLYEKETAPARAEFQSTPRRIEIQTALPAAGGSLVGNP